MKETVYHDFNVGALFMCAKEEEGGGGGYMSWMSLVL